MTAEIDARMAPAFNIVDEVLFLSQGGKCINDVERIDLHRIQSERPDIIILMIGDNDVLLLFCYCCSFFLLYTDCEGLAGRLVSLASRKILSSVSMPSAQSFSIVGI